MLGKASVRVNPLAFGLCGLYLAAAPDCLYILLSVYLPGTTSGLMRKLTQLVITNMQLGRYT
jgi:hypothetical protein